MALYITLHRQIQMSDTLVETKVSFNFDQVDFFYDYHVVFASCSYRVRETADEIWKLIKASS